MGLRLHGRRDSRNDIRIGTAGWSVPRQHARAFPEEGSHLQRYAAVMNAVEINTSFYRPHQRKTYERWAHETPQDFRFAVKAPKQATHVQRLENSEPVLDRFATEIAGLGSKLGPILVQLPPSLPFDEAVAAAFFSALAERIAAPIVCEPRHASWFAHEVDAFLDDRRIARVAADPAPVAGAERPGGWRGLSYVRLHGSPRTYYSNYDEDFIARTAQLIASQTCPIWCVFDNTAAFAALGNALSLRLWPQTASGNR